MELTSIIGLIVVLIGLLVGMVMKGVSLDNLANPAAILIILVGTLGAVITAFPGSDIKNAPRLFGIIFGKKKMPSADDMVEVFTTLAAQVRKDGLLSLEASTDAIDDPFFKRGIELLMTGQNREFIEDVLSEEIEATEERHLANATIFVQAGTYAPTLGVLGAVVGLIAAMADMSDTNKLAHAIGGAFMATIYGIFTGYCVWHPFANKLKRKSKIESRNKYIILQGIILLEQALSPDLVKDSLSSYLSGDELRALLARTGTKGE